MSRNYCCLLKLRVLVNVFPGKQKGWKQYVTIASDYEWGRSTQKNTVEILKKQAPELTLKKEFWPPLGETRFSNYIMGIG